MAIITFKSFQQILINNGFPMYKYGADGYYGDESAAAFEAWGRSGKDLDTERTEPPPIPVPEPGQGRTSPEGVAFLHGWENCKLTAYKDSGGVLTIGWGHTSNAGPPTVTSGMTISQAEADEIFVNDIRKFEERVVKEFGANIPQCVFDGATSFDYNTGAIYNDASWPDYWKKGDMAEAEERLKQWNKAGGQELAGLTKRRAAEADMIFRNNYSGRP